MIAIILLRVGKDFSIPDGVSAAIIGLFFGLVCGLFYYQHYYKPYFWAFSLLGGLLLTIISNAVFARFRAEDDVLGLGMTIASFAIPFVLTLVLNHGMYLMKRRKRKRRKIRREHPQFFHTLEVSETRSEHSGRKSRA